MSQDNNRTDRRINRRRLLQGMGVAGVAGVAGCLGSDGGGGGNQSGGGGNQSGGGNQGGGGGNQSGGGGNQTDQQADFSNLQPGGTLRIGVGANVASFDPPYSTDTTSSEVQSFIFESLVTQDTSGEVYPWLAESYELVKQQSIERTAYEPYMTTVSADSEGALATEEQVIVQHPEDNPLEASEVRVLLPEQAAAAVDDGTFGMQYRYNIHQGVKFHNGEELTADNVVATAKRYENSDVSAQTFDTLLHARKVDKYTVDLYAQVPDAEAESQLPSLSLHSMEQATLEGGALDPRQGNNPLGTGPYTFESFEDAQSYSLSKFDNYWVENMGIAKKEWFDGPKNYPDGPVIDKIEASIVPDNATRSAALQNGEIDVTKGLNTNTLDQFEGNNSYTVASVESGGYEYIQYPVDAKPFNDPRVRKAVNHLVPRKSIVNNVLNGWARPAWTPLPELAQASGTADIQALRNKLKPKNQYNPERAKQLMEEAANELGFQTPIEVQLEVNADNDDRVQMVELIAESMQQSGHFKTSIETYEWNTYVSRVLNPEYPGSDKIIPCIGLSGTFNPGSFCDALHGSENIGQCCNLTGISNKRFDRLVNAARFGTDVVKSQKLRGRRYDKIWDLLARQRYSSITHFDLLSAVMNNNVKGFGMWPFDEGVYSFALYGPTEQQAIWLNQN